MQLIHSASQCLLPRHVKSIMENNSICREFKTWIQSPGLSSRFSALLPIIDLCSLYNKRTLLTNLKYGKSKDLMDSPCPLLDPMDFESLPLAKLYGADGAGSIQKLTENINRTSNDLPTKVGEIFQNFFEKKDPTFRDITRVVDGALSIIMSSGALEEFIQSDELKRAWQDFITARNNKKKAFSLR